METGNERYVTTGEAAALVGVDPRAVRYWCQAKLLRVKRVARTEECRRPRLLVWLPDVLDHRIKERGQIPQGFWSTVKTPKQPQECTPDVQPMANDDDQEPGPVETTPEVPQAKIETPAETTKETITDIFGIHESTNNDYGLLKIMFEMEMKENVQLKARIERMRGYIQALETIIRRTGEKLSAVGHHSEEW